MEILNSPFSSSFESPKIIEPERIALNGDVLLVFGQGPVLDSQSRMKAADANTPQGSEDINFWSKDQAAAVWELYKRKAVKHVINLGGNTGGIDPSGTAYKSEAELIAEYMEKLGVPKEAIGLERQSDDTVRNILNFINLYDKNDELESGGFQIDILTAPFHSVRVNVLMQLLDLPVRNTFKSTAVLKYAAMTIPEGGDTVGLTNDFSKWNNAELDRLEDMENLNDPTKFSKTQKGLESRDILDRYVKDEMWTRELLEYPEKWISEIGDIQNSNRVLRILQKVDVLYPGMLDRRYDINIDEITTDPQKFDEALFKLKNIPKYKGLDAVTVERWKASAIAGEEWPEETRKRFDALQNMSTNTVKRDPIS